MPAPNLKKSACLYSLNVWSPSGTLSSRQLKVPELDQLKVKGAGIQLVDCDWLPATA